MSRSASAILRPAVTQGLVAKAPQSPVSRAGASLRQAGSPALPAETHAKALSTLQESLPRSPRYDDGFLRDLPPRQNVHPGPSSPRAHGDNSFGTDPDKPPDERKVKLGKTVRILQERLPTLLQSPLPQEILSPNISLHLFPSTHPHLPVVSGRVAYIAALWTSPIAWNRVPLIGNVRLEVVTARMVQQPPVSSAPRRAGAVGESLLVRWRTIGKSSNWGLPFVYSGTGRRDAAQNKQEAYFTAAEPRGLTGRAGADAGNEFTGLFIFEFDGEGRILSHTIEHVQEGGQWEQGVGAKVVGLTDWLLGGMKGDSEGPLPAHFSRLRSRALVDAKLGRITTRRRFPLCGGPGR